MAGREEPIKRVMPPRGDLVHRCVPVLSSESMSVKTIIQDVGGHGNSQPEAKGK